MKPEIIHENSVDDLKNLIESLRKQQVQIQTKIEKQEDNGIFDESLYNELDNIDEDIDSIETRISNLV